MNTDKIELYNREIAKNRTELEQIAKNLIVLLQTVDIEYINFYEIINTVDNCTTVINKLEYLKALELK